jgi:hypothetical protein
MPNLPVTASSRELQRPRPIPRRVRDVITLMVYGRIDDESGLTMQSAFILASGAGGLGFALLLWRLVLRRAYEACMVFPFARHVSERGHGHRDGFRFSSN